MQSPGGVNASLKHAALTSGCPKLPDSAQVFLRDEMAHMHIGSVLTSTERIQFSLPSSARRLQERPLLQFFERPLEFLLRVHHDRTVPSNGLL
jgi:hypothetical protein